mmetsp:Transcript_25803/g.65602  ORF Transcript_25803/g.65602 Transcript_25803/m.65602 type:complete len:231 (+) Transcript_25803:341-1033(+)
MTNRDLWQATIHAARGSRPLRNAGLDCVHAPCKEIIEPHRSHHRVACRAANHAGRHVKAPCLACTERRRVPWLVEVAAPHNPTAYALCQREDLRADFLSLCLGACDARWAALAIEVHRDKDALGTVPRRHAAAHSRHGVSAMAATDIEVQPLHVEQGVQLPDNCDAPILGSHRERLRGGLHPNIVGMEARQRTRQSSVELRPPKLLKHDNVRRELRKALMVHLLPSTSIE